MALFTRFTLLPDQPLNPRQLPIRKFMGKKIIGGEIFVMEHPEITMHFHSFQQPLMAITMRQVETSDSIKLACYDEITWLRMDVVLEGQFRSYAKENQSNAMGAGHYQLVRESTQTCQHKGRTSVISFYFSPGLLNNLGTKIPIQPCLPRPMTAQMSDIITTILDNPYEGKTVEFFYANRVRDLLFCHIAMPAWQMPGKLSMEQLNAIHEADRLMGENFDGRMTIHEIAKRVGTNFVTLKKRYEHVFGVGIFQRMMQRRMEYIKKLLEETDKPLKDISVLAGYRTTAGFITEFRKRFGVTPNEWRKRRKLK